MRASYPRTAPLLLILTFALVSLTGCGKSALERQEEYYRRTEALNAFDFQAVLAGRDPVSTLKAALFKGGCVWLSKELISTIKNRSVVVSADFNPETKSLRVEIYSDSPWGLSKIYRATYVAYIAVDNLQAFVRPPTHSGPYQCWTLYFDCLDGDCVWQEQRNQIIGSDDVTDRESSRWWLPYWELDFSNREAAIEACAALRALSGQDR